MAYRSNVGQLANVIAQGGAQRAQSLADQWAMGPQAVQATIGGYQDEMARQQAEQYQANQDQYYETQRQRVAQEVEATERATVAKNLVHQAYQEYGDNDIKFLEWAEEQDNPEVLTQVQDRMAQNQETKTRRLENEAREAGLQFEKFSTIARRLDAIERSDTPMELYQSERAGFMAEVLEVGIPQATVDALFPEIYDAEVLRSTANRGWSEAERREREESYTLSLEPWGAGWSVPRDPERAEEFLKAADKSMMLGLLTKGSKEEVEEWWKEAEGDLGEITAREFWMMGPAERMKQKLRLFPDQTMEKWKEYREYDPDKWAALAKEAELQYPSGNQGTYEARHANCVARGDVACATVWLEAMEAAAAAKRAPAPETRGGGGGGTGIPSGLNSAEITLTMNYVKERSALADQVHPDGPEPPATRLNPRTREWERINRRELQDIREAHEKEQGDGEEVEGWDWRNATPAQLGRLFVLPDARNSMTAVSEKERLYSSEESDAMKATLDKSWQIATGVPDEEEAEAIHQTVQNFMLESPDIMEKLGEFHGKWQLEWQRDHAEGKPMVGTDNKPLYSIPQDRISAVIDAMTDSELQDAFSPHKPESIRALFFYRNLNK